LDFIVEKEPLKDNALILNMEANMMDKQKSRIKRDDTREQATQSLRPEIDHAISGK